MPKSAPPTVVTLRKYTSEFPCLKADGDILFCTKCSTSIGYKCRSQVVQHIQSFKHQRRVSGSLPTQTTLTDFIPNSKTEKQDFNYDLAKAMVESNIPLYNLEKKPFKDFLKKYTKFEIPSESTLRKYYVDNVYDATLQRVKSAVADQPVWACIDETTDILGRYVANCIVGLFDESKSSFLVNVQFLPQVNHTTVSRFLIESLNSVGINLDNFLVCVTDGAAYMKKALEGVSILAPKMIHINCLAHNLHRVAEKIRELNPVVDKLIANGKKVFRKAPVRRQKLREMGVPLPPDPIITRWGTWLRATEYYLENVDKLSIVVNDFDENDSHSIGQLKALLDDADVKQQMANIHYRYLPLVNLIHHLERREAKVHDALNEIDSIKKNFEPQVLEKLEIVLAKNKGLERILKPPAEYSLKDRCALIHAPPTSCDVERSFSSYKHLLSDKRCRLTPDNLKKLLVVQCNAVRTNDE
jgi:hypothetical protein